MTNLINFKAAKKAFNSSVNAVLGKPAMFPVVTAITGAGLAIACHPIALSGVAMITVAALGAVASRRATAKNFYVSTALSNRILRLTPVVGIVAFCAVLPGSLAVHHADQQAAAQLFHVAQKDCTSATGFVGWVDGQNGCVFPIKSANPKALIVVIDPRLNP